MIKAKRPEGTGRDKITSFWRTPHARCDLYPIVSVTRICPLFHDLFAYRKFLARTYGPRHPPGTDRRAR